MSDTFDHEGDAWESYERGDEDGDTSWHRSNRRVSDFQYDPLFHHTKLKFVRMTNTTEKAVQVELGCGTQIWLPRSVCRKWKERSVMVHSKTLKRSLAAGRRPIDPSDLLPDLD